MTYFTHQFVVNIHNLHRGQMSHCVLFADLMSLNTMACYTKNLAYHELIIGCPSKYRPAAVQTKLS